MKISPSIGQIYKLPTGEAWEWNGSAWQTLGSPGVTGPAGPAGNNGSTIIESLSSLTPALFDIDLAGNRVITLKSGTNIYVQNTASLGGNFIITAKRRNF
jgi:hypothetical protein